ncbi:twin-arginine translocation signal domain-containing protein [Halogeometricum luteum]|uniref:Twin-arginine translocation signal domain-containing protein n=1 Tax=Halogeometricum luteum TaxID=2950537 RepID=A0ABU2G2K3_9EURY|nr:twin-arginine translocation signal domain-containing protein [Halogeometricum sp. S3BR5-2]MDS0295012.1 twin-arginine translocation signal domain-containing protein [Halogeometricum sp. S3BR5-2]
MPSRRNFLRRVGATAAVGSVATTAGCLNGGFVRTKLGGGSTDTVDLSSPDDDVFVPPDRFDAYRNRMRAEYGAAAIPWSDPDSLPVRFLGARARRMEITPSRRLAVQDAALLVHRLADERYRLRLWSAGRLLGKRYEVDPWGYYTEEPAFTWLEQEIEAEADDHLSAGRSLSTDGGRVRAAGGAVTVPDGSYESNVERETYRSRWEGFHPGVVPLVGACELSFVDPSERRFTWSLSNGVGIRTPY